MSCRVLQRGVEQLAMNKIFEFARRGHYERVVGHYIPTSKNMMVKNFFEQFGFRRVKTSDEGATEWHLEPDQYVPRKIYIDSMPAATHHLSNTNDS
jgi:predicted enzyme involved in methoxymalonyl-ACP biosynthesis